VGGGSWRGEQARFSFFERAPYKQQAVENHSITCQIKKEPSSWTTGSGSRISMPLNMELSFAHSSNVAAVEGA
jgi:hypothetical protein